MKVNIKDLKLKKKLFKDFQSFLNLILINLQLIKKALKIMFIIFQGHIKLKDNKKKNKDNNKKNKLKQTKT